MTAIRQRNDTVRLETTAGPIEAAQAIVTAGAWTAPLLGAPFDRLLRVTRQVLHWFAPDDPAASILRIARCSCGCMAPRTATISTVSRSRRAAPG